MRSMRTFLAPTPVKVSLAVCVLLVALAAFGFAAEGAEGAHHVDTGKQMKDFAWRCLDFAALFALLAWALKKANVKGALADRRAGIEKMLQEAVEAKAQAEKKFAEYSDKLEQANREIEGISAAMKQEGELEKARIIAEAKAAAEKIKEQAEQTAQQEVLKARAELREEAARLAVAIAEQKLKENINKGDQDKLVGNYISKVVTLH
ncbi:ATP synthase F0 subunit B [Geotalea sp. SG265]|uniref:ATP synthase F0 subunit B n=1 Tax=Geotalea sp. SG265 TaxID=2922867 RepID=UPI001FAF1209|nr:ATP synthase F0 subunit B [Geotalea sp. SG265]